MFAATTALSDLALAPVAGYLATKVMEPVSSALYELESEADRAGRTPDVPGARYRVAVEKTAMLLGVQSSDTALGKAALAFHYGLAMSWAPT